MFLKIQKRSLAFLLALILVLSTFVSVAVIPASAAEADVAQTSDDTYSYLNGKLTIESCNYVEEPSCFEETASEDSYEVTAKYGYWGSNGVDGGAALLVTNNSSYEISFDYTATLSNGTIEYQNDCNDLYDAQFISLFGTKDGSFTGSDTFVLGAGHTLGICLQTTGGYDSCYATLLLDSFHEIIPVAGYATVSNNDNATIIANGTALSSATESIGFNATDGLTLEAQPAAGYGFLAWIDPATGEELSSENPAVFHPENDIEVAPVIYENAGTTGYYGVKVPGYTNEAVFDSLADALEFEDGTDDRVITVLQNVTYDDDLAIPSGTTLLIPFDADHTVYRDEPEIIRDHTTPTAYVIMTMQSGSKLTVEDGGSICLGGQLCARGQIDGWNGAPTGPDGRICMKGNSTITVENGGNLYAWGYIYRSAANDEGSVIAESGATVYEPFQIKNYRGGSATFAIYQDTFPFNQYYIQNIEVPLKVEAGAKEYGLGAISADGQIISCAVTFIGEGGLFVLEDGYLIKDYIEEEDRLNVKIYGDSQLSSMSVTMYGITLNTDNYPLPITNNISVELEQGDLVINQDITMLPGTELSIADGASMTIEKDTNVYVYDADQWNGQGYVGSNASTNFISVGYSVANGTNAVRTNADIVDAQVDINGDVVVNGGFYCTDTGNVSSSQQTGTITYATNAETSTSLEECRNNAQETTTVEFGVAQLKKPDGTYESPVITDPETGATYFVTGEYAYENEDLSFDQMYYVTWLDFEGDESAPLYVQSFKTGETPVYGGATPTHANSEEYVFGAFTGWATEAESATPAYNNNNLPAVGEADVIYYATYVVTEKVYTVKWNDKDGNELYTLSDVPVSAIDPSIHEAPELPATYSGDYISASTAYAMTEYQENYAGKALKTVPVFKEWSADYVYDDTTNEGVCTLTPLYNDVVQHLVLFVDGTGTDAHILDAQYYAVGAKIKPCEVYSGATPTKASDETYSYTYSGWQSSYSESNTWTYALNDPDKQFTVTDLTKTGSTGKNNANKNTLVVTFSQTEAVEDKHSLTLNGDIGVNFYHKLPEGYTSDDITADFSWGNKYTATNTYSDEPNTESDVTGTLADGVYVKFTLPIAVKNLNDEITVQFKVNDEVIGEDTYKPTDYAYQILGMTDAQIKPLLKTGQTAEELREVVRTMLIYAAAAQENFNYNTEHLATDKLGTGDYQNYSTTVNEVDPADLGSNDLTGLPGYLEYYGSSLNLGSKTAYDLCFINRSKTELDTSATYANSEEAVSTSVRSNDIAYVVRLEDLPAAMVTADISLNINGSTVTANVGEYIKAVLAAYQSGDALYDTVTALYAYNQSAVAFFS